MSDLLDIIMKDPAVKEEIILRAKKAIKNVTFTKQDITKIKTAIINAVVKLCDSVDEDDGGDEDNDSYYEIQELITKEMKRIVISKFKEQ